MQVDYVADMAEKVLASSGFIFTVTTFEKIDDLEQLVAVLVEDLYIDQRQELVDMQIVVLPERFKYVLGDGHDTTA